MTIKRRISLKPDERLKLTEPQITNLLFDAIFDSGRFPSPEAERAAAFEHREFLMDRWFEDLNNLGKRPWCWWRYFHELVEMRKQLFGFPHIANPLPQWGQPVVAWGHPRFFPHAVQVFESEFDYLSRHALLFVEEVEQYDQLKAKADAEIIERLRYFNSGYDLSRYLGDPDWIGKEFIEVRK